MKAARISNRPAKLDTAKLKEWGWNIFDWIYGIGLKVCSSMRTPLRRTNDESSKTRLQTIPWHI